MNIPSQFIVVDDDPFNNLICRYTIAKYAPADSIQLFTDPEKALAWIKEEYGHRTDHLETILFLDINMPGMSGWEFLDEFSSLTGKLYAQFKIFILSSSIDPGDKEIAEKHTLVSGIYSKPLSKETINKILEEE